MAPLMWRHHTLLQALLNRGPLPEREFLAIFAGVSGKNPATHQKLFNDTLLKINKELAFIQFELRACMNQYDGIVYYGVVNNIADEESKFGTKYSVPQVAYYKGLLEAIVLEAGSDGSITSIDALNVQLDNQVIILDGGSQHSQSRLPSSITDFKLSQKEKTIDELVKDRWLSYTSTGKIGLGIRSFLDLRSWFRANDIPLCVVCNESCIKASSCHNEGCNIRIHEYCLKKKFSQRKASRACPGCGTEWLRQEGEVDADDDADEPGEDGAASANRSSRKRRKGVKAELVEDLPSRKRRKGVEAELVEDRSSRKRRKGVEAELVEDRSSRKSRKGVKAELVEDNHNAGPAVPRRARSVRRAKAEAVEAAQEVSSAAASKVARGSKGRKK